jgi:hypothetical protein
MNHDNSAADREELEKDEEETSPEESILKGWLPEPQPNDDPSPAP